MPEDTMTFAEKTEQKRRNYIAAVDAVRDAEIAARQAQWDADMLDRRLGAEIYGDGSAWNGLSDPRYIQAITIHPEMMAANLILKAAADHMSTVGAAFKIAEQAARLWD